MIEGDLNEDSVWQDAQGPFDAVISATTLHWFKPELLDALLKRLAQVVRPQAQLIVSDTVSSNHPQVQALYRETRERFLLSSLHDGKSSWQTFWETAGSCLSVDIIDCFRRMTDAPASEDGLRLSEIQALLLNAGFQHLEVHWAHYGEIVFSAEAGDASPAQSEDKASSTH